MEDPVTSYVRWDFLSNENEVIIDEVVLSDTVGVQEGRSENILTTPLPVPDIQFRAPELVGSPFPR